MNNEELVKLAVRAGWPVCPGAAHLLARPGNPRWLVLAGDDQEGLTNIFGQIHFPLQGAWNE